MAEPTLAEVFGGSATQDGNSVVFWKAELGSGFTPALTNRDESIYAALILKGRSALTPEQRATDLVNRNITVEYVGQDLVDQGGGNVFLRDTFQVSLYKPTSFADVVPDNY